MSLKVLFLIALLYNSIYSQTVEEIAEKTHIANINTLLIFTSQEGLNSGLYSFTNVGVDMEVYSLPFTYHLESDTNINYFIVGNVGYSRVYISQKIEIPPSAELNYDNHLRTYTGGLGGGVRYKFYSDFSILGGAEFIYSRSGASVKKPDDNVGDAIEDFFNENYNDNLSYKFFAALEYRPIINEFKPYALLTYKLYETKSTFNFDELTSFNSSSDVTTLSLGFETPKILEFDQNSVTLEAYVNANYLSGTVEEVIKFSTYRTIGGVVYFNTPAGPWWASRFFLETSTVQSSGLDGYSVGIGFTLDF